MRTRERGIGNLAFIAVLVLFVVALAMFFVSKDEADKFKKSFADSEQALKASNAQLTAAQLAYDALVDVLGIPVPEIRRTENTWPPENVVSEKTRQYLYGVTQALAKAGEIRLNSKIYQIPEGQNVVTETQGDVVQIKLYTTAYSVDTITFRAVLDPLGSLLKFMGEIARENNDKFETTLSGARQREQEQQNTINEQQTAYQNDLANKQAQYESLSQEKTQVADAYQAASAKNDNLETGIAQANQEKERAERTFKREIAALENRIIIEKELKALALAEDPKDGEIQAVGARGTVHINLGRKHKLSAGTKFIVWRPGKGSIREDFAVVRVFKVERERCEARVISRKNPNPITRGMYVSNPFFNPKGSLTVYIYGDLKEYPTAVAKRRLAQSGVRIAETLDDRVDVIVLGEPPVVAEEIVEEEEAALAERRAGMERSRRLNAVMDTAKTIGAIVVTEKVLATFLDY